MTTVLPNNSYSSGFHVPYKTSTKIILGKEWVELLELLSPEDQRDREDSVYWQLEYFKAISTKHRCNKFIRDIAASFMLVNIGGI